jgi:hypothetical protein
MGYLWLGGDSWERQKGDGDNRALISLDWTPSLEVDEAADDSDKSFTVPADTEWRILWIWVELVTAANVGNRNMEIQIQDAAADVVGRTVAGVVQAASLTRHYLFASNATELAAFRDTDYLSTIMPEWYLPEGYIIRVWDNKAIAAAADDMVIQMMVLERTVT